MYAGWETWPQLLQSLWPSEEAACRELCGVGRLGWSLRISSFSSTSLGRSRRERQCTPVAGAAPGARRTPRL